jgi:paraquat-inducible protein B
LNPTQKNEVAAPDFPAAKIKKRARFSFIWIIPVIAAGAAAWLMFQNFRETGPAVSILFTDGNGLQANQTVVKYRGVRAGEVRSVHLTKDTQRVEVRVRLERAAENLAREGSVFWIVRPEVSSGGLHGLETIVSGPYIEVQPGVGKIQKQFVGADQPPVKPANGGLEIILTTPHMGELTVGSPVYYRGVEVGSVQYFVLSDDATVVNVHVLIETNFAPLVRTDTKFWNAGGINVDLRFFHIDLNAQSIKSLVIGGIAFATPSSPGEPAPQQTVFPLNEKVEDGWLKWSPSIPIANTKIKMSESPPVLLLKSMNQDSK